MGWGNILPPYEADDAPNSIPAPSVTLADIGVDRWHYDLWHKIIQAALDGHPDQVDLSYHEGLKRPAVSRYGATTPALLKWFNIIQCGARIHDQVKPFNFLNAFQARPQFALSDARAMGQAKAGPTAKAIGSEAGRRLQSKTSRSAQSARLIAKLGSRSPASDCS